MHQTPDANLNARHRIDTRVYDSSRDAERAVAREIADLIRSRAAEGRHAVLGLATGSTPTGVYAELIRMHREGELSFANVVTFNLDEYYPMAPHELQSYVRFMNEHLFDHVDIDRANVHVPDGTLERSAVPAYCAEYEKAIERAGGIDLQVLGIGRTGHIGFNEPGSGAESRTRLITLDRVTRMDAAGDFFGEEHVPRRAITMGVATITQARRVILMAFGEGKAPVVAQAIEGPIADAIPASFLQRHPNAQFVLDRAAAAHLTRYRCPWVLGPVEWDEPTIKRAVIWLARKLGKAILKLTDADYNENHLQDLLAEHDGTAYEVNIRVFRAMQQTITGWPGGKPAEKKRPGDIARATDAVFPKRCICFSPHPDDDVISMGGTLIRLVDQGHEVHVGYQTSGNLAVFDADAIRFADFAGDFNRMFGIDESQTAAIESHIEQMLKHKEPGAIDSPQVQKIKALIRRGEAKAGARAAGVSESHLHFLDLPFYETGTVRKSPIGEHDVAIVASLLRTIKPHQVYCAGDLSDPHGTHRVCLAAILRAIEQLREDARDAAWIGDCEVWLYRGAWQEWEPDEIEMAVPLSPRELERKIAAIFRHQSQKDKAMFPGHDRREFWQRAEDRNRATADLYNALGLPEYAAMEGFVRWKGREGLL